MKKFVAIMGMLFVCLLSACATVPQHYYTTVDKLSLITRATSVNGKGMVTLYLTVANPTSERKHFVLRCCMPLSPNECMDDISLVVSPRSDKHVTVRVFGSITCELIPNRMAHE